MLDRERPVVNSLLRKKPWNARVQQHVPVDDGQPACCLQAADETIQDGASDW